MSNVNQNTFKIIQAANRSLELHKKKFNIIQLENKDNNDLNILKDKFQDLNINKNKNSNSIKCHLKLQDIKNEKKKSYISDEEKISKTTENKIKELEYRISNVLEYSSQLEKRLKSINHSKLHCCCNNINNNVNNNVDNSEYYKKKELYEYKLISILKEAINSISEKYNPNLEDYILNHPYQPQIYLKKKEDIVLTINDIKNISNYILDTCIEEIIINIDDILHSISLRFIKESF